MTLHSTTPKTTQGSGLTKIAAQAFRLVWKHKILFLLLVCYAVQKGFEGRLVTALTPNGIMDFELAYRKPIADAIVTQWKALPGVMKSAKATLCLDFVFIVLYVMLLLDWSRAARRSVCIRQVEQVASGRGGRAWAARVGCWIAQKMPLVPFAAGVCDGLENLALLVQLNDAPSQAWTSFAYFLAVCKFVLLSVCLLYLFIVFVSSGQYDDEGIRKSLRLLRRLVFSIGSVLAAGVLVIVPDQSTETLRVLAADFVAGHKEGWGWLLRVVCLYLATTVLAFYAWYWAWWLTQNDPDDPASDTTGLFYNVALWTPRLCGLAPPVIVAYGCWKAAARLETAATFACYGFAVCFVVMALVLLAYWVAVPQAWKNTLPRRLRAPDSRVYIPNRLQLGVASLVVWLVVALIVWGTHFQAATSIGPMAVVLIGFATAIPVGSLLTQAYSLTRVPFITLFVILAFLFGRSGANDNHAVRLLDKPRDTSSDFVLTATGQHSDTFSAVFMEWLRNRPDLAAYRLNNGANPAIRWKPEGYPVIVVAAEGGGLRAAYHTAITLALLHDKYPDFAAHLFAISGVSGGSVGAATYAALARNPAATTTSHETSMEARTNRLLARDFLSPTLAALCYGEALQWFVPFQIGPWDRARALEIGLETAWDSNFVLPGQSPMEKPVNPFAESFYVGNVQQNFVKGEQPWLFLNTTDVQTGERMVLSSVPVQPKGSNTQDNLAFTTLSQINPDADLRLSTAAFLSARFPFVSPPGTLPILNGQDHRPAGWQRFVDGGYYENSGAATLNDVINAMKACVKGPEWNQFKIPNQIVREDLDLPPIRIIVLRIGLLPEPDSTPAQIKALAGFGDLLSPLLCLFSTRDARAVDSVQHLEYSLNTDVARASAGMVQAQQTPPDTATRDEYWHGDFHDDPSRPPLALGWLLSQQARDTLTKEARAKIEQLPWQPTLARK